MSEVEIPCRMMDDSQQRHCDICWIEGGHAGVLLSLGIDFAPGYLTAVLDVEDLLTHYDSALGPLLSITDSLGLGSCMRFRIAGSWLKRNTDAVSRVRIAGTQQK
jgi:hypothetical protein